MFTLHGSPKYILAWLSEYVDAKCLNTSSSGVKLGEERRKKIIRGIIQSRKDLGFFTSRKKQQLILFYLKKTVFSMDKEKATILLLFFR